MGTNYYFITQSQELVNEHFAKKLHYGNYDKEYRVVDEPYLGYQIHLNKLSAGWKPLFEEHKEFRTFDQLKGFYNKHKNDLQIYNGGGNIFTWEEYFNVVHKHSLREIKPFKWVYKEEKFLWDYRLGLDTVPCTDEEAELYIPFDHMIYRETEKAARYKFGISDIEHSVYPNYWNDPDYLFDWCDARFS